MSAFTEKFEHCRQLRDLAWWAYLVNGSVASAVNYIRSMHTLDAVPICLASKKKRPRNYSRNATTLQRALDIIRYRTLIRDMLLKCCNDGTYFYYMETTEPLPSRKKTLSEMDMSLIREINSSDMNLTVIALPINWCRIIGRRNNSYVGAFNLKYFETLTGDDLARNLRAYPAEIREGYEAYISGGGDNWLILDNAHTMIDKIKTGMSQPWGVPLTIAALNDVLYSEYFVKTKRAVLDEMNNRIVYQTFPEGREKGMSALTGDQQTKQHNSVKEAVLHRTNHQGTSFFSLPGGTKLNKLDVDTGIFDDKNEGDVRDNVAVDVGIAPSVLNGAANGNYATSTLNIELLASSVYSWIEGFVNELNKCLNELVIKDTSCPVGVYIFPITFVNRDKVVSQMSDLYTKGKGSLTAWIAATGIRPDAYISLMDYELEADFEHRYPVHMTSYVASTDTSDEVGRPSGDDVTSQSAVVEHTNGGNEVPKPSI